MMGNTHGFFLTQTAGKVVLVEDCMDLVVSGLVVSVLTGFLPILAGSSCPSNFGSSPVLTSEGADFLLFIFIFFYTVKVQPLRKSVFFLLRIERKDQVVARSKSPGLAN